jgi:hypothetical protein
MIEIISPKFRIFNIQLLFRNLQVPYKEDILIRKSDCSFIFGSTLYTSFEGNNQNLMHSALSKYSLISMANELTNQTYI